MATNTSPDSSNVLELIDPHVEHDNPLRDRYAEIIARLIDNTATRTEWDELPYSLILNLPYELFRRRPQPSWDTLPDEGQKSMFVEASVGNDTPMHSHAHPNDAGDGGETDPDGDEYEPVLSESELAYVQNQTGGFEDALESADDAGPDAPYPRQSPSVHGHNPFFGTAEDLPDYEEPQGDDSLESISLVPSDDSDDALFAHHPECECPRDHYCMCIHNWQEAEGKLVEVAIYGLGAPRVTARPQHVQSFKFTKSRKGGFGNGRSRLKYEVV